MVDWIKTSRQLLADVFGALFAAVGGVGAWITLHQTPVFPSLVFMFMGLFGFGCLLIVPALLKQNTTTAIDLLNLYRSRVPGGDRETDPPADPDKK